MYKPSPYHAKTPPHPISPSNPLRLNIIHPPHSPNTLLNKIRPSLNNPHQKARNAPAKQNPHAPLRPNRHNLRRALSLLEQFRRRFRRRGEVLEDGGAERADGVEDVQHRELAVGCDIADGVDAVGVGGRAAEGGGVDADLVLGGEPVGGQPGGVADAAGCVDGEVYAHWRGAVGECDEGFAAFLGAGGDFVVVDCGHAHAGEVCFGAFPDFGAGVVGLAV